MTFADTLSRITGLLALVGQVLLILSIPALLLGLATSPLLALLVLLAAPTLSALAQLALSRNREFEADRSAAELSGDRWVSPRPWTSWSASRAASGSR